MAKVLLLSISFISLLRLMPPRRARLSPCGRCPSPGPHLRRGGSQLPHAVLQAVLPPRDVDAEGFLVGWENIKTGQVRTPYEKLDLDACRRYAFSGIHVFSPYLLEYMKTWEDKFSIIDFYLSICKDVPIRGVFDDNLKLVDVGKFETLSSVEQYIADNGL